MVADLSEALDVPVDRLAQTPSFVWDWDIPNGMVEGLQELFLDAGVADYEEPVPAEQVIDRSFVGEAVGIPRD